MLVLDCEVFADYFLLMFKNIVSGKYAGFEIHEEREFQVERVKELLKKNVTIGFNSANYDLYVIAAALGGWDTARIKKLSDELIKSKLPSWRIARNFNLSLSKFDHVDLIEVAPGKASLKIYGGRLGAPRMQDLPFDPDASISQERRKLVREYCANDLDTTERLFRFLEPAIKLRGDIGEQYGGMDLRSKSDAQIAEAVIKHELTQMTGQTYTPAEAMIGDTVRYLDPKIVSFESQGPREVFNKVLKTGFPIGANGAVQMPDWLRDTRIKIGRTEYQMGIGGLHSCEKSQSIIAKPNEMLCDFDVASYYPSIILKLRLAPKSMGRDFLRVYQSIVTRRLEAKKRGDKLIADTLKIVVNGSFGKLGSMYSALYAPELMIQVTITGQLCLLMLIERVEAMGARVVSANTDGIVVLCDKSLADDLDRVTFDWMLDTSFELERSDYQSIHSRDVNNYIAVKMDGKTKRKGAFSEPALAKNPEFAIVNDALAGYLSKGASIEKTIKSCRDITKFVTVRRVDGGALWRGNYLGKAVRFYYSTKTPSDEYICYAKNKNKVPRSDGARPLMELPEKFPDDVEHDRYIGLAKIALKDIGFNNA